MLAVFFVAGSCPIPWLTRRPAVSPTPTVTVAGDAKTGIVRRAILVACCLAAVAVPAPNALTAAISLAGIIGGLGAPFGLVATALISLIAWYPVLICSVVQPYAILVNISAVFGDTAHNAI